MNAKTFHCKLLTPLIFVVLNSFCAQAQLTTGQVDFDVVSLRDREQVTVSLSDSSTLILERTEVKDYQPGAYTWVGTVVGSPKSIVVFSVDSGYAIGDIQKLDRWWVLEIADDVDIPVVEIDSTSFPTEDVTAPDPVRIIFRDGFERSIDQLSRVQAVSSSFTNPYCIEPPNIVDVQVAYTGELARDKRGNVEAWIRRAIELANLSFILSSIEPQGLALRLNLVSTHEVEIWDSPEVSIRSVLIALSNDGIEDVFRLREEKGADISILLTKNVVGGRAWLSAEDDDAFGVVQAELIPVHTFTHEIGHLFFANHDKYSIETNSEEPVHLTGWNYGFTHLADHNVCDELPMPESCIQFFTIGAVKEECVTKGVPGAACYRAPVFSGRTIYADIIAGDVDADNSRQLEEMAPVVACHRTNPLIVDIPFSDPELSKCVLATATENGWIRALDVRRLECIRLGIESLQGVEYFKNLAYFDFEFNPVRDFTPLTTLSKLYTVRGSTADDVQIDLSPLANKSRLKHLKLYRAYIKDLTFLADSPNLVHLNVEGRKSPISNLSGLENKPKLQELLIRGLGNISDISALEGSNLEQFWGSGNKIVSLDSLAHMTTLSDVQLNSNSIVNLSPFAGNSTIENLGLGGNLFTDVTPLYSMQQLKYLGAGNEPDQPGALTCEQQRSLILNLPNTNVTVARYYDDPNDEYGPLWCGIECGRYYCGDQLRCCF